MAIEIERKFLLADDSWRTLVSHSERLAQGYLVSVEALRAGMARASVRVRVAGEQAWLNIKEAKRGIARAEYEVPLPVLDAQAMLETLCDGVVEKIRHHVHIDTALFEIDEFLGANEGLIVAEIELPAVDASFPRPNWLGREVSALERYYNVNLVTHPFVMWSDAERIAMDGESF